MSELWLAELVDTVGATIVAFTTGFISFWWELFASWFGL